MGSHGRVSHEEILEMLRACAPGCECRDTPHYYRVMWRGKTYPSLPKGEHGKRPGQAEVEIGHVRKMIRHLGIDLECARRHLPILK